jgi:zinc D-Ala-D-Ala carboxypeptidase
MEPISAHISYQEATNSTTAKANGINNTPSPDVLAKMKVTAAKIFEPVRVHFGKPIKVSSFFRSVALNKKIGGAATSQHVAGEAIDMDGDGGEISNKQIFEYIHNNLKFDQLIVEGIHDGVMDWVHCSYREGNNREQILFMYVKNGKKIYDPYTLAKYKALIK